MGNRMRWRRRAVLGLAAISVGFPAGTLAGSAVWTRGPPQPRPTATTEIRTVVLQPATEDAFDWLDAGIGGAVALGLTLVTAGTSIVLLRQPEQRAPLDPSTPRKERRPLEKRIT